MRASRNIKRQLELILKLDGSPDGGHGSNLIIALTNGEISHGPERGTVHRDACRYWLSALDSVQRQFSVQSHPILSLPGLAGGQTRTLVHDVRERIGLEDFLVHPAVDFLVIF